MRLLSVFHLNKFILKTGLLIAVAFPSVTLAAEKVLLSCPPVMAHTPIKSEYPEWFVYSNKPLRLTGADISYVVDAHLEATLDPDRIEHLNDSDLSVANVFDLLKHRAAKPFSLECHYGVHAQLSRKIPAEVVKCTVIRHGRFGEEGEFEVFCQ